jgi:hypothetical protein
MRRVSVVAALGVLALSTAASSGCTRERSATPATDLLGEIDRAVERRPVPGVFSLTNATISGVTKRALLARESTRIVFSVTVPERAELQVSLAVEEDVWRIPSDGILFRILIGDSPENATAQYYARHLNPHVNRLDRGWQDVTVDLSAFAGKVIRLYLNTNFAPRADADPAAPTPGLALWAEPRIVRR